MNLIEELRWRGMIQDVMPGTEEQLLKEMTLLISVLTLQLIVYISAVSYPYFCWCTYRKPGTNQLHS